MTRIKEARIKSGLSQSALAIKASMEPATLSLIEHGKRCTKRTADKLAGILGVRPEKLWANYLTFREG